jgi:hypothetical protein
MRQTELRLTKGDRKTLESYRLKNRHRAQEINRAHILSALDRKVAEAQIMAVLSVGRTTIWRTRNAYLKGGLAYALHDDPRSGRPLQYGADEQSQVSALACSTPPEGMQRWTTKSLMQAARRQAKMLTIAKETIRRLLKKASSNPGAKKCGV